MKTIFKISSTFLLLSFFYSDAFAQNLFQKYELEKNDSIRIGLGKTDFLKYVQKGFTFSKLRKDKTSV
ncbi:hypothetical protein [Cytophaga sp. FL35]|uniref:hypothetical protein n=1 Tax=Cytophaga sp. FL35 TaxID=1904456 RepID=UPI001653CCB8|nr:hypothetical protein [Cytophaga sp. FL35]MBC7000734.1 hypothetical protein [Cytophaga sp. FL35]